MERFDRDQLRYAQGMVTPEDVAFRFIQRAEMEGKKLSQLELHKLVYAAQGWHLGIVGEPLFPHPIEAWKFGPVIPSLRRALRGFGAQPISSVDWIGHGLPARDIYGDSKAIVDDTWDQYKNLTASQLVTLTHWQDTPWSQTYDPNLWDKVIPQDVIREHFAAKLEDVDARPGI